MATSSRQAVTVVKLTAMLAAPGSAPAPTLKGFAPGRGRDVGLQLTPGKGSRQAAPGSAPAQTLKGFAPGRGGDAGHQLTPGKGSRQAVTVVTLTAMLAAPGSAPAQTLKGFAPGRGGDAGHQLTPGGHGGEAPGSAPAPTLKGFASGRGRDAHGHAQSKKTRPDYGFQGKALLRSKLAACAVTR